MRRRHIVTLTLTLSAALLLAACAVPPSGRTVLVLPGPNKPFEAFQQDQAACTQYAASQVQGQAQQANARVTDRT